MHKDTVSQMGKELLDRLSKIPTSTLANALDSVGIYKNVLQNIKSIVPTLKVLGPAVTVKEVVGEVNTFKSSDFAVGSIIDAAANGDVIVIEAGGAPVSTWGGMASLAANIKGIAGLIVDGGVRDFKEIVDSNFPVFTRHIVPTTGRTRLKVEAINVPVSVGGVLIAPKDIIVGDSSGVLSIPSNSLREIIEISEKYAIDDANAADEILSGLSFTKAMAKYTSI